MIQIIQTSETGRIEMPDASAMPYIYVVLSGSLRLHTPSGILDYAERQYSVSAIDTPTSGNVLYLGADGLFRAVSVPFTLDEVLGVMLEMEDNSAERIASGGIAQEAMDSADANVLQATERLITLQADALQRTFLVRNTKRELLFHVLCGSMGRQFLQAVSGIRESADIYKLNSWIKSNYRQTLSVTELADRANMSVSSLHQKFKKSVGMGLLQCQKRLRLTEARRLMLDEDKNAMESAENVGYVSFPQFIREYRKMFGRAPKEDIIFLKSHLSR